MKASFTLSVFVHFSLGSRELTFRFACVALTKTLQSVVVFLYSVP